MKEFYYLLILSMFLACNSNDKEDSEDVPGTGFDYEKFSKSFQIVSLPYQIVDTGLLSNKDTSTIENTSLDAYIPDSLKKTLFKKPAKIKYIPLVRVEEKGKEKYYVVKAVSGNQSAALLITFDKENNYAATLPFIVPDNDPQTTQTSAIDKAYSISRNVSRRISDDEIIDGKEVYAYNRENKTFTLIMTDLLDDGAGELLNPIDTFKKTNPFAGDYLKGDKNIVSVRDGRNDKEVLFFIHFEIKNKKCKGELKGKALFTSSRTAVYREGGDPCILELHFATNTIKVKEIEGCGSHRGLDCMFDATFTKKKQPTSKATNKKTKKR